MALLLVALLQAAPQLSKPLAVSLIPREDCGPSTGLSLGILARPQLDLEREHLGWWRDGWVVGLSLAAAGQLTGAFVFSEPRRRAALLVGAAKSAIGVISFFLTPIRLENLEDLTCDEAVHRVLETASAERRGRAWWRHVLGVGLNVISFLILGLAFDAWVEGAIFGMLGVGVGQAIIWSQPAGLIDLDQRSGLRVASLPLAFTW